MKRLGEANLATWYQRASRKPLVIRGARQVGKSTLVRNVAKNLGVPLWEINLEKHANLNAVFATFDIAKILQEISLSLRATSVCVGPGILFLDEIQATPQALAALRYFYEERPELAVIATGSLLEFTLSEAGFSMPVGRIEYGWLGPMTFSEYLEAQGDGSLILILNDFQPNMSIPLMAHERLNQRLREFLYVGGMPEAVARFIETGDAMQAVEVHHSILETYQEDFSKYARGADLEKIRRVFALLPANIGQKIRFNRFHPDWKSKDIRRSLELLTRAGIAIQVTHCDGSGVPLAAGEDPTVAKLFHLDVGLAGSLLGTGMIPFEEFRAGRFINEGPMAEQFVAQHLWNSGWRTQHPSLHYWLRGGQNHNAEVDFLVQNEGDVLPIEVKSGASGSLRSLHQFMAKGNAHTALRFDLNTPSDQDLQIPLMTANGLSEVRFHLCNRPLYMAGILKFK
jgi:predicted AAA+ superfamily ATPase